MTTRKPKQPQANLIRRDAIGDQWQLKGEVLANFTAKQLEMVGAIAMLFNACEMMLHRTAWGCMAYPGGPAHVTFRVGSMEGLIDIIMHSVRHNDNLDPDVQEEIEDSLRRGFLPLKTMRDSVIHSRPKWESVGVSAFTARRAQHYEVLVSEDALSWLATALHLMEKELQELCLVVNAAHAGLHSPSASAQWLEALPHALGQYRALRTSRKALRSPPKFPEPPPILSGRD